MYSTAQLFYNVTIWIPTSWTLYYKEPIQTTGSVQFRQGAVKYIMTESVDGRMY